MSEVLFQYHKVNPTTWVYLSSLLTIGLFFKFSRLLSVRNLDLIGLILLATRFWRLARRAFGRPRWSSAYTS